jgi:hypothetical protein
MKLAIQPAPLMMNDAFFLADMANSPMFRFAPHPRYLSEGPRLTNDKERPYSNIEYVQKSIYYHPAHRVEI